MRVIQFLKAHKVEVAIFLIAVFVRFAYFGASYESRGHDLMLTISGADCYYSLSENILHGNGYSCDTEPPYSLNAVRPPVYPYFIALTNQLTGGYWGVLIVQILIGSMLPLIAMRIARYIFADKRISYAAGFILALEPFSILFSIFFYSETLFMLFFLSSVLALFAYFHTRHPKFAALSATLLGMSVLTKPTVQYMFIVAVLFILIEARKHLSKKVLLTAAGYAALFFLVITPWLVRNYAEFGAFSLSPQKEVNIYSVMVPSVLAIVNNTNFQVEFKKILESGALDPNSATFGGTKDYVKMAVPVFLAHPVAFTLLNANTALNFFIHDGMYDVLKHVGIRPQEMFGRPVLFVLLTDPGRLFAYIADVAAKPIILILVGRVLWILVTVAFVLGVWRYLRREPRIYGILAMVVVCYFLLTTLVVGLGVNARYRMPVNAIIVAFAAYEIFALTDLVRKKIKKHV